MLGTDELTLIDKTLTYVQGITPPYRRAAWMKAFQELQAMTRNSMHGHVWHECKCHRQGCQFCDGGLAACTICDGFEGSLPTECPKRKMTKEEQDAVYTGALDYTNGRWMRRCDMKHRPECEKKQESYCKCGPIPFGY